MATELDDKTRIEREAKALYPDIDAYGIILAKRKAHIFAATKERERAKAEIERLKGEVERRTTLLRKQIELDGKFKYNLEAWQQFKTENNL